MSRFISANDRAKGEGPRIGDLPIRGAPVIPAHLSMAAARRVAELKRAALLFVEQDGRLLGLLDARALKEAADEARVADSLTPLGKCLHPQLPAAWARELFRAARAAFLPVAAGAFLLGVVSRADLECALRQQPPRPALPARARAAA